MSLPMEGELDWMIFKGPFRIILRFYEFCDGKSGAEAKVE